ncbi:MAG: tetratricopeptide repeat protein, partial [Verrucomicrobiales bacterium]
MTQIISFQSLTLELGSRFLEAKEFHRAIACLQRVWSRQRLERHQGERLAVLQQRHRLLEVRPERRAALFALDGIIARVEREVKNFRATENFDSALRLRLATAFQGLGRLREAALVMEDMLLRMEPDAVVESATLAQIQCWMEIGRWPKAVEAADSYVEKFTGWEGDSHFPTVLFLRAQALQSDDKLEDAEDGFAAVALDYPDSQIAPRAQFMHGFVILLQNRYDDALEVFARFPDEYPGENRLIEDAFYWQGMCLSFRQDYAAARAHMARYLEIYPGAEARYRPEASFRIAFLTYALVDYVSAAAELESFIAAFADDPLVDEARLLLGDALLGEGDYQRGLAAYASIAPAAVRFFEDGWFKTGKVLRLLEDLPAMRAHFDKFIRERPESARLPEAVYWIGWTWRNEGDLEKTREIYWQTVGDYGDDPERFAIADILLALPKIYPERVGRLRLISRLEELAAEAKKEARVTLALRVLWAKGRILGGTGTPLGTAALLEAGRLADPEIHNPLLLADCADALRLSGNPRQALELYQGLRKWHPRAVQKDRAYAGLGLLARERGDKGAAIIYFEKFEKAALGAGMLG